MRAFVTCQLHWVCSFSNGSKYELSVVSSALLQRSSASFLKLKPLHLYNKVFTVFEAKNQLVSEHQHDLECSTLPYRTRILSFTPVLLAHTPTHTHWVSCATVLQLNTGSFHQLFIWKSSFKEECRCNKQLSLTPAICYPSILFISFSHFKKNFQQSAPQ